jgi:dephospho-CoA kinase
VHLFGLTGGIASGKTTVAARFRAHGVPVIDADQLAREVVARGSEGLRAIVESFGHGVLGPDGALDRKGLGRLVFSDDDARRRINAITHPRIAERVLELADDLRRTGERLACYEAALIVENGASERFRPLVVVACPAEVQLERVLARDGATRDDALARIRAQMPLAEKVSAADFVIDSNGPPGHGARQADDVLRALCARLGIDPDLYGLGP